MGKSVISNTIVCKKPGFFTRFMHKLSTALIIDLSCNFINNPLNKATLGHSYFLERAPYYFMKKEMIDDCLPSLLH